MLDTFYATMRETFSDVKSGAGRSPRVRNVVIGVSRALDPMPRADRTQVTFVVNGMTFGGGFARDRANLVADRLLGERRCDRLAVERKNVRVIQSDNGKTAVWA